MSMLRTLVTLCLVCLVPGCQAPRRAPLTFQIEHVSARHRPSFDALLASLERREHQQAESILRQMLPRLESEAASSDELLAAEAEWQLDAALRFQQIVAGRLRLEALELSLEVQGEPRERRLVLRIANRWPAALILDPGSAILERTELFVGPGGQSHNKSGTLVLDERGPWTLPPLGETQVTLLPYPEPRLGGAIANRDGFALRLGSGSVTEDGVLFPAEDWPRAQGLRVNLAAFLPNGSLEPNVLLEALGDPTVQAAALMERTVRILPKHYDRALEGVLEQLRGVTPEIFERYQPVLAWLHLDRPLPIGLEAWRSVVVE